MGSPLNENIESWRKVNAGWAAVLETIDCQFIFFHDNPDGSRNLAGDIGGERHFFYSQNATEEEWVKKIRLQSSTVIFIYGIGLGYSYRALEEWLRQDTRHRLVYFEDNLEVVHRFFETDLATEFLNDSQVRLEILSWPLDANDKTIAHNALAYCFDFYDMVALDFYQAIKAERFIRLKELFASQFWNYRKNLIEILNSSKAILFNFFKNIFLLPTSYQAGLLKKQFSGIPAIICGAGPSLGKNIDVLKGLSERALIFGAGTSMNALNSLGFIPHFGVGIDPNPAQFERIMANNAFEVPFFYRNRMNVDALQLVQGDRLWISGAGGYLFPLWFEKELGIEAQQHLDEGHNVINFSLSIAEMLGCDPIVLVGVDLAYTGNQSYSPELKAFALSHEANAFTTKSREEELIVQQDIFGKPVYTLWKWKNESDWIGAFAEQHPSVKIINATEGGIGFPGISNLSLAQVAEDLLKERFDPASKIHAAVQNSPVPPSVTEENIQECIETFKASMERCETLYEELALEYQKQMDGKEANLINLKSLDEEIANTLLLSFVKKTFDHFYSIKTKLSKFEQNESEQEMESARFLVGYIKNTLKQMDFSDGLSVTASDAQMEITKNESMESLIEGNFGEKSDTFYPDGSLKELWFTRKGELNGPSLYFNPRGTLLSISLYENGLREGASLFYYASGKLKASQFFKHGKHEGRQEYFYETGRLRTLLSYVEGKLHGEVLLYYPDGKTKRTLHFKEGLRHGVERLWNLKGNLMFEAHYKRDKPVGTVRGWHPNGQPKIHVKYDDEGKELGTEEWNVFGQSTKKKKDYFDQLIAMTNILSEAIDQCYSTMENLLIEDRQFLALKQELLNLKEANQKIQQTFSKESFKEAIWKSDTFQKQVQHQVEDLIRKMAADVILIQQAIETVKIQSND